MAENSVRSDCPAEGKEANVPDKHVGKPPTNHRATFRQGEPGDPYMTAA